MSSKKDKFIENAQKLIIKGQLEKAVFELEQAVALDPADLKVRQKLAEILVRVNRQSEAISQYETIGKSFSGSGFYLKAIAVYKQIQKLDPENTKTTLTLAELNVNHGLVGNALSEFSLVVNHYLKSGKQSDALQLLERMLEVDPSNLNTMLKIAETLLATGNTEEAYERYCNLAQQLWNRPDKTHYYRLCERIKILFPDKGCAILRLVSTRLERGETAEAFANLKEIISHSPDFLDAWLLMADTIRGAGDTSQLKGVLEKITQRFPSEIRSREELIELALSFQDIDNALRLLNDFRALLIENSLSEQLEKFYNELQRLAPMDERPIEGLCWLFEQTGDTRRLTDTKERLAFLHEPSAPTVQVEEQIESFKEPEKELIDSDSGCMVQPTDESIPEQSTGDVELSDWEEEIELELDEELVILSSPVEPVEPDPEPLLETPPEIETTPEISSEIPETWPDISVGLIESLESLETGFPSDEPQDFEEDITPELHAEELPVIQDIFSVDTEAEEVMSFEEGELQDRVILTIENPLPVEAFLPGEPEQLPEMPAPETGQGSPWDEISSGEQSYDGQEQTAIPPAEELVDLLVGNIESYDWSFTDNRNAGLPTDNPSDGEVELEVLTESDETGDITDATFELEDLTSFTEALFGEELSHDAENPESDEYSLGNMLSAFKKGVDEQLDESDTESHYNLGIAYKEMGLYDEAIHEFRLAGHDPRRAADCISLQGICLREKGDFTAAEAIFREGLNLPLLSSESHLNLKYELALLLEQADRPQEAVSYYNEIIRINHSYRDVSLHISRLSGEDDLDILIELKEGD